MLYLLLGWLLVHPGYVQALPGQEDTSESIVALWENSPGDGIAALLSNAPAAVIFGPGFSCQGQANFLPGQFFLLKWQVQLRHFLSFCLYSQLNFLNRKIVEAYPER